MYQKFLYRFLKDDWFIWRVWIIFLPLKKQKQKTKSKKQKRCEQLQVTTTPIYHIIIPFNQILSSHQPRTLSLIYWLHTDNALYTGLFMSAVTFTHRLHSFV